MMRRFWKFMAATLAASSIAACHIEVTDDEGDEEADIVYRQKDLPMRLQNNARVCEADDERYGRRWFCYETEDYRWRSSCRSAACRETRIFVHYMLEEPLGNGQTVYVEAFTNEHFQGYPAGSVRINEFRAERGEWQEGTLFLPPGEYFLRAYLTTADETVVPYRLGGMDLVADRPVGVYGALSGAKQLRVDPRQHSRYADPVHIYLSKLLQKSGSRPETNARLRIRMSVEDPQTVPDRRSVLIQIFTDADLWANPVQEYSMASELFRVVDREGSADFLSPSMEQGEYIVFAFIDTDGNGMYDAGELAQVYQQNGAPQLVSIAENRTVTIDLALVPDPDLPEN